MVGPVDGVVVLAGTGSGSVVEMHTVAELVHCIDSLQEAAVTSNKAKGVRRNQFAMREHIAGCLAAHTGCTMAEARPETHTTAAAETHKAHVAVDKGKEAHTGMDCAGPAVGHIDCMGPASWV